MDFLTVLVPRSDYRIEDMWDVVGLRGTASNDVVVETAFVPAHRVLRNYEQAQLKVPGQQVNPGPLYRLPFGAIFTSAVTAPVLGAVSGGYASYVARMKERVRLSLGGGNFADDPFAQVAIARAASDIDASVLQMDRNMRELLELASAGQEIPVELRLRTRRDQVRGTERAVAAIDLLFKTAAWQRAAARQPRRTGLARRPRGQRPRRQRRGARTGHVRARSLRPDGRGQPGLTRGRPHIRPSGHRAPRVPGA